MTDRTNTKRRREPVFNVPGVIVACCIVLLAIHFGRGILSIENDNAVVADLALLPARLTLALNLVPTRLQDAFHVATDRNPLIAAQVEYLIGSGQARPWTFLTYAFLHGSWAHVGFNCIWLVAFGSAVARPFSVARFLLLLAASAIIGAVVQYATNITSFQIVIGASAAVAGAMGAATRFIFRPSDEPQQIFDRTRLEDAFRQPALSVRQVFTTKAALVFVLFWFVTNLLFGVFPSLSGVAEGPIAWPAHIGGFMTGLLLFRLFDSADAADIVADQPALDLEESAEIGNIEPEAERPASLT